MGAPASVTRWAPDVQKTHHKYPKVPVSVLLGLTEVESTGRPGETSSTGAQGITQFEPGTARQYKVNVSPGHEQSQLDGAAHYLTDLLNQFHGDMHTALAAYNAGPGNVKAGSGYATTVLTRAKQYTHYDTGTAAPTHAGGLAATSSKGKADTKSDNPLDAALNFDPFKSVGHEALYATVFVAILLTGAALVAVGFNSALSGAPARAANKTAAGARDAAVAGAAAA